MEDVHVLGLILILLIIFVVWLFVWVSRLQDEVTNMRYIKAQKKENGEWELTTRDNKTIFDL